MNRNEALLKMDITCSVCRHTQSLSTDSNCLRCGKKLDQIYLGPDEIPYEEYPSLGTKIADIIINNRKDKSLEVDTNVCGEYKPELDIHWEDTQ